MTPTKDIFRFFRLVLEAHLTRDPDNLPIQDPPGVPVFPALGVDWVRRAEGDAVQAVRQAVEALGTGNYKTGILLAFSTMNVLEEDAAGQEFSNTVPVTVIIVARTDGRAVETPGLDPDTSIAEWLDDITDEVYQILDPDLYDPYEDLPNFTPPGHFYNYQYRSTFALQGASNWKGRRLSYLAWRLADKQPSTAGEWGP